MKEEHTSLFAERKKRPWVWIIPSLLVHLIILVIWLLFPEPEPRQPGERKLIIKEEQAEALQEHLENANLDELQQKISELQSIKARMVDIRERQMRSVANFEATMVTEAPQNIAGVVRRWIGLYEAVQADYARIEAAFDFYAERAPGIRQAAENDLAEGLRRLPELRDLGGNFEGMGHRFEVAFYETAAALRELEMKLEWLPSSLLLDRVEAWKRSMAVVEAAHNDVWREVPGSWKRGHTFAQLTEDVAAGAATVKEYREREREGLAAVAQRRAELESGIAAAEAQLNEVRVALETANRLFEAIDQNQDRQEWTAQRSVVRGYANEERRLVRELQDLRRNLDRTQYREDRRLASRVRRMSDQFWQLLTELPDCHLITLSIAKQGEFIGELESFALSLEGSL